MINYACRFYRGASPCTFNKKAGEECPSCKHVSEFHDRVLFIKLDAIGDVLRSASLIPNIIAHHQAPYIAWLTKPESASLVRMVQGVDEVIETSDLGVARAMTGGWTAMYSLSNDISSSSLATLIPSKTPPVGYYSRDGVVTPSNAAAQRWLELATFDRLKKKNAETYQRRMMAIIGDDGPFTRPTLHVDPKIVAAARNRVELLLPSGTSPRLALNVGAGRRWPKKMLGVEQIATYIGMARQHLNVDVILVGGEAETEKTHAILALCGNDPHIQAVLTPTSIPEFVATLMNADVLFCGDTLALHIATAIDLPTVAIFGPTSAPEIADFDGLIAKSWVKTLNCLGCYSDCAKSANCMSLFDTSHLVDLTARQLARAHKPAAVPVIGIAATVKSEKILVQPPSPSEQPLDGIARA